MRNILIIGSSSSIGDSIEKKFINNGDNVLSTYHSSPNFKKNPKATYIKFDLSLHDSYAPLLKIIADNDMLDALIILAGILPGKSIDEYTEPEIEEVLNINFISNIHLIKALTPYLNLNSNIVIMSSIAGLKGSFDPVYAASKAAQIGLVKSLALWSKDKYKINAIAPSLINESTMFFDMAIQRRNFHKDHSPCKKLISKAQIAQIIFDVCEPNNGYSNGEILEIDGGNF
jgi:3-oxoacyl-[acyl-carrier protein] reductase